MLNVGESGRRIKTLATGGAGAINHLRDKPEVPEGGTIGGSRPVGAGWDPLGGAGASLECWRGLGVQRWIVWAGGASGLVGPGRPWSPSSLPSSLLEQVTYNSWSKGWGPGFRRRDWASPAFPEEGIVVVTRVAAVGGGGGAAARDGLWVAALGACGVSESLSPASMSKCIVRTGGVFLYASGTGWSKPIAVSALGVAVSLRHFLDLERLREEKDAREEDGNVVGVDGENHRSGQPGPPGSSVLVKVPGRAALEFLSIVDPAFDQYVELFVVFW